jgi:hypothetical protein
LNIDSDGIFEHYHSGVKGKYSFLDKFKDIWADNGDYISIQYTGTGSTHTSVTKNGKEGVLGKIQHGLVSINRFYQGSYEDNFKQKCFEIVLHDTKFVKLSN